MNFLFPVDATALHLKYRFDNFLVQNGHPEMIAGITEAKCRLLALSIVCQELRQWFLWHPTEEKEHRLSKVFGPYPKEFHTGGWIDGALTRLMPGYETTIGSAQQYEGEFLHALQDQVLDPIAGHVNTIFAKIFEAPTWNVCLMRSVGYNLLLEFKGDYRIWDWHYSRGVIRHTWDSNH